MNSFIVKIMLYLSLNLFKILLSKNKISEDAENIKGCK